MNSKTAKQLRRLARNMAAAAEIERAEELKLKNANPANAGIAYVSYRQNSAGIIRINEHTCKGTYRSLKKAVND